jgi:HAMP domain-containing protein
LKDLDRTLPTKTTSLEKTLKRKIEEQEALVDSLRSTIDGMLREHGVQDYVTRLQDHVGALTRQLAATAEQRDKLQNLYVANDRELERLARELALSKSLSPLTSPKRLNSRSLTPAAAHQENGSGSGSSSGKSNGNANDELEELRLKFSELSEELERERKEGYAAARMHLTYEADLRAEIKALQEQMLTEVGNAAMIRQAEENGSGGGLFSSLIPW